MLTQCLGHNQAWSSGINTQGKQLLVLLKLAKWNVDVVTYS